MKYSEAPFKNPVLSWSESDFQSHVITLAKQLGFKLIYHTHDSRLSVAGFPDLVMVNPLTRRTLFVELKAQNGRVSADQEVWLDGLRIAGQFAEVWRPSDWVSGRILNLLSGREVRRARA